MDAKRISLHLLLFAGCFLAFRFAPGYPQICDSRYSLLVARNLVESGDSTLDAFVPADSASRRAMPGYVAETGLPYSILALPVANGRVLYEGPVPASATTHYFYSYPLGSSAMSAPFVAWSKPPADPAQQAAWEDGLQLNLAALLCAGTVCLFTTIARTWLNELTSIASALVFSFGSPVWSTMSRGLWSHTWAAFLLALALLLLVRLDAKRSRDLVSGLIIGALLFWCWFVRPQTAISSVAIGLFFLLHHRRAAIAATLSAACCFAIFAVWSERQFGHWMPPCGYMLMPQLTFSGAAERLPLLLFSPSRGIVTTLPVVIPIAWVVLRYRQALPAPQLVLPAVLAILAQIALLACFPAWTGGASFGPRLFTDVLPWVFLLGVLGIRAAADLQGSFRSARGLAEASLFALCCCAGLFIHARGAISPATWRWNQSAGACQSSLHSWRQPQWLAGLILGHKEFAGKHLRKQKPRQARTQRPEKTRKT